MKTIKLAVILLLSPIVFHAQSLTGLWSGTLSNDSNTIRRDQSFEIVLTQYKDKVYGYSRMTFFVHDTLYYIVKRVKGTVEGDICQVKDDDIISHNFPRKPDKGVKLVSTFRRNQQDSLWRLDGDWQTTESKRHGYYSISGKIALQTETDLEKSKLIPHLEELKLADDVAFYRDTKKAEQESVAAARQLQERSKSDVAVQKTSTAPVKATNTNTVAPATVKASPIISNKPAAEPSSTVANNVARETVSETTKDVAISSPATTANGQKEMRNNRPANEIKAATVEEKKETAKEVAKSVPADSKPVQREIQNTRPADEQKTMNQTAANTKPALVPATEKTVNSIPANANAGKENRQAGTSKTTDAVNSNPAAAKASTNQSTVATMVDKPVNAGPKVETVINKQAATFVAERKIQAPQSVFFKSDSLELSLYDNGEIDGDTVSVLLNGELILAKQGLKASAIKKTIYVTPGSTDSLTLVLYAENLGKYPPNTGLLVVHDGDEVYQIRFSADLQQNAAIIFRRKRN